MFNATVTVNHASLPSPIVRSYNGLNKKQINKLGLALSNVLMKLSQKTDAKAQGGADMPDDSGPRSEATVEHLVTEDGVKWTHSTFEWPNQSASRLAFIVAVFDGEFANIQAHFDKHQIKEQGGKDHGR